MFGDRRRRRRRRRRIWALVCAALLLEVGWRVYLFQLAPVARVGKFARLDDMPARAFKYRPHPYLVYALNETYASDDGRSRHNSLGLRGPEVAREKRPGVFRIACIGGSTTYESEIADDALTYPAQLERALRENHGHAEVEVLNAGVPGYSSWETLIHLELCVLDLEPDLVIYYDNTNDVHPRLVPPHTYRGDNTGYRTVWQDDSPWWDRALVLRWIGVQTGLSPRNALLDRTTRDLDQDRDRLTELAANPPVYFRRNLDAIVVLAQSRGAEVVLASWAWCPSKGDLAAGELYQRGFAENNAVIAEVAVARSAAWFDFRAVMPTDGELWADGTHVNADGARAKALLFAQFVAAMLPAR